MELQGRLVQFAIRDIAFPSPDAVIKTLHEHDLLAGRVLDVSDSGETKDAFVVVKVEGLEQLVVVPVAQLKGLRDLS